MVNKWYISNSLNILLLPIISWFSIVRDLLIYAFIYLPIYLSTDSLTNNAFTIYPYTHSPNPSIHLSMDAPTIHLSTHQSLDPPTHLPTIDLFIYPSVHPSTHLWSYLSTCSSVSPPIHPLTEHLSSIPFNRPDTYLPIHPLIHSSIHPATHPLTQAFRNLLIYWSARLLIWAPT